MLLVLCLTLITHGAIVLHEINSNETHRATSFRVMLKGDALILNTSLSYPVVPLSMPHGSYNPCDVSTFNQVIPKTNPSKHEYFIESTISKLVSKPCGSSICLDKRVDIFLISSFLLRAS